MAELAHNPQQEFWRPPMPVTEAASPAEVCGGCGTEFMVGSRFCHSCGMARSSLGTRQHSSFDFLSALEFHNIKDGLGLSTASLIAFLVGSGCALFALLAGIIYSEKTLLDWQAVQLFRIQWLLASIASFVAGVLLKKKTEMKD
ncbi:MAG TPA: hypothetical protein VFA68_10360 [Terriglobales bacterium]|nr:hypothetical protein [Terriglobales bacterium]